MKHSSEMYEKASRESVNYLGNESTFGTLKCKVCRAETMVVIGTETAKDIKHAVSEFECLKVWLS